MSNIDKRGEAYENKFVHDEETRFKATALSGFLTPSFPRPSRSFSEGEPTRSSKRSGVHRACDLRNEQQREKRE